MRVVNENVEQKSGKRDGQFMHHTDFQLNNNEINSS